METNSSFKKSDLYARVTSEIIRAIEAGMEEYKMPWHQGAAGFRHAVATKHPYRGVNPAELWSSSRFRGFLQEIAAKKERAALSRGRFRIIPTIIEECQS